jgi:serine protease AprX
LRVLDQNGEGNDSTVIEAVPPCAEAVIQYPSDEFSLGREVYETYKLDPLCQAVEAAWKDGIVVVVSAGNNGRTPASDGYGTLTSPGNDPYVTTLGAMKPMGTPTRLDDRSRVTAQKGRRPGMRWSSPT